MPNNIDLFPQNYRVTHDPNRRLNIKARDYLSDNPYKEMTHDLLFAAVHDFLELIHQFTGLDLLGLVDPLKRLTGLEHNLVTALTDFLHLPQSPHLLQNLLDGPQTTRPSIFSPILDRLNLPTIDALPTVLHHSAVSAANLVLDPAFENFDIPREISGATGQYSTEFAHGGLRSYQLTTLPTTHSATVRNSLVRGGRMMGAGARGAQIITSARQVSTSVARLYLLPHSLIGAEARNSATAIKVQGGHRYSMECWAFNKASNQPGGNYILGAVLVDSTHVLPETQVFAVFPSVPGSPVWTKLSGSLTVTTGYDLMWPYVETFNTPSGSIFYYDDGIVREETAAGNIRDAVGGSVNATIQNIQDRLQHLTTDGLGKFDGAHIIGTIADLQTLFNNLFDGHNGTTGSTGKTLGDVLAILQTIFDANGLKSAKLPESLFNNLFDGHNGTTGSTGKTLADVLTVLQTIFDGGGLKSAKLPETLFNNLFDGHKGTTGSTGKTLADVLTSLQDLFNVGGLKAAKTPDITLGMSSGIGGVVDGIVNKIRGLADFGFLQSDADDAVGGLQSTTAANTAALQALLTQSNNNANSGNSAVVDFTVLATASTLPAAFTQTYSGSGTSTLGIQAPGSGLYGAYWTIVTGASRTCQVRYNALQTLTDYQKVGCGFLSAPAGNGDVGATLVATNTIKVRVNSSDDTYVYVEFAAHAWELGCVVSGSKTVFHAVTAASFSFFFSSSAVYYLEAGTIGGLRVFRVWQNSTILYTHTEVGTTSQVGASYRYTGAAGFVAYSGGTIRSPGAMTAFAFYDNTPPTLVGSTGKMSRTGTGTVTFNTGANLAPTSFFGTNDGTTSDLTADLTNGKFTVTIKGNYVVTIGYKVNSGLANNSAVAPVLYKNGSIARVGGDGIQPGGVGPVQIRFIQSTFKIELDVNDTVQAGYNSTAAQTTSFTGESTGTQSYFEIALANKSLA